MIIFITIMIIIPTVWNLTSVNGMMVIMIIVVMMTIVTMMIIISTIIIYYDIVIDVINGGSSLCLCKACLEESILFVHKS